MISFPAASKDDQLGLFFVFFFNHYGLVFLNIVDVFPSLVIVTPIEAKLSHLWPIKMSSSWFLSPFFDIIPVVFCFLLSGLIRCSKFILYNLAPDL